jgi:molybdopterin molybdotransferase
MSELIVPKEALARVLDSATPLTSVFVPAKESLGRILAKDIDSDRDYPPFNRAMMDGYAVRVADAGKTVRVDGEIAAGQTPDVSVRDGVAVGIMTGAPCPNGCEAVVQKELVKVDGDQVTLPEGIVPGRNIAPRGTECQAGATIIKQGTTVSPLHLALLATFGEKQTQIIPAATVHLVVTGRELVAVGDEPGKAQIRNSNAPMLEGFVQATGARCTGISHAADETDAIVRALAEGSDADCVITTGGVSAGNYDLVPEALEHFGADIIFHGVEQRPGKPMLFARKNTQLIFGLSGNPMACLVGYNRYVLPALRSMMGMTPPSPTFTGELVAPVAGRGAFTYYATAHATAGDQHWKIEPISGKGSADMFSTANANALIHVPPGADFQAGDNVTFQLFPGQALPR